MSRKNKHDEQTVYGTALSVELTDCGKDINIAIYRNKSSLEDPDIRDMISEDLSHAMEKDDLLALTICNAFGQFLESVLGKEATDTIFTMMTVIMEGYSHAEDVAGELFNFKPKGKE